MENSVKIYVDILLDGDFLDKDHISKMLRFGLRDFTVSEISFSKFVVSAIVKRKRSFRSSTVLQRLECIFSAREKENWLDQHTDLRLRKTKPQV